MKSSSTYIVLAVKLLILFLLILTSCAKDNMQTTEPINKTATVTFALKLPDNSIPTTDTRALDKSAEEKVDDVVIIAFKDGEFYFIAYSKTAVVNNVFTIDLFLGDYEIMILANVKTQISKLQFNVGETKASVEAKLKYVLDSSKPKWVADINAPTDYRHIPMSSSIRAVTIKENLSFKDGDAFILHRIMAKININVKDDPLHIFKLTGVYLYNYNLEGYITPKFDAGKTISNIPTQSKQSGPIIYNFPETSSYLNEIYLLEALNNDIVQIPPVPLAVQTCIVIGGKYNNSAATYYYRVDFNYKNVSDELQHIDLLRNHRYEVNINKIGGVGYDSYQEAYDAGEVRNIESEIIVWNDSEITYVKSDGIYSLGVEKESVTIPSDAKSNHELLVMSNYIKEPTLKVSSSATNANAGGVDWMSNLRLEKVSVSAGISRYTLYYDVTENKLETTKRTAYIHIKAGTISLVIAVTQNYIQYLRVTKKVNDVWVEIDSLIFAQDNREVAPIAEKYRIEWAPKSLTVSLALTPTGGEYKDITWLTGPLSQGSSISNPLGQIEFEIQPEKIAGYKAGSFTEAQTKLNLKLVDEGFLTETLVLHQYAKEIYIDAPSMLPMDGYFKYISVKANVPWTLYANKNISSGVGTKNVRVVQMLGTVTELGVMNNAPNAKTEKVYEGKYNLPDGANIPITTVTEIFSNTWVGAIFMGHLGLYAEHTESPATNDTKSILCASGINKSLQEANCYVLNPENGVGIAIPVYAANGHMFDKHASVLGGQLLYNKDDNGLNIISDENISNIGQKYRYGAKLVWADECGSDGKGLSDDGLLSYVTHACSGEYGYILVIPGTVKKEGNAVVAVTRNEDGTGDILWSWHIWVTKGIKFEGGPENNMKTRILGGYNGTELDESGTKDGSLWLDRNLGALNNGGVGKTDMYTYGLHYQWGRKDPFPNINKTVAVGVGNANERQLYDANGPLPMKEPHGSVIFDGEGGTTVRESIQTPLTFYYHRDLTGTWLTDHIFTLWGVTYGGDIYDDTERGKDLGKSIFDPCPAGYRVPVRTSVKWDDPNNTKHWGSDTSDDVFTNMGKPTENLKVDHGFQWPSSTLSSISIPYKGGWYPGASQRYLNGINTVEGWRGFYLSSASVYHIEKNRSRILLFNETQVIPSNQMIPYAAGSVRCVAY